jgi:hypothetical protein
LVAKSYREKVIFKIRASQMWRFFLAKILKLWYKIVTMRGGIVL